MVVGATLKLRRLVEGERVTLTALFDGVRAAAVACAAVTASGVQPAIMELMMPRASPPCTACSRCPPLPRARRR